MDPELASYMTGKVQAPIPTYFVGSHGKSSRSALAALEKAETNIKYLGAAGVVEIKGLSVAFLDGIFHPGHFTRGHPADGSTSPYFSEVGFHQQPLSREGAICCQGWSYPCVPVLYLAITAEYKFGSTKNCEFLNKMDLYREL